LAVRRGGLASIEEWLARMAGNRSSTPTVLEAGGIRELPVRPNARAAARAVQERIRTLGLEDTLAGFEEVDSAYGPQPTTLCHRGELRLWAGHNAQAEADFLEALALEPKTRWAWIGLGAARLMNGNPAGCLATFAEGEKKVPPPGRTMHVYRTEAHLARGETDAAEKELRITLELNPERISAHLLRSRIAVARGDAAEERACVQIVERAAPGLYADAVEVAGSTSEADVREACFAMMRGNRASGFVSYFLPDGRQRFTMINAFEAQSEGPAGPKVPNVGS
jgi:tetratricopeptide (TPR) repeat protein